MSSINNFYISVILAFIAVFAAATITFVNTFFPEYYVLSKIEVCVLLFFILISFFYFILKFISKTVISDNKYAEIKLLKANEKFRKEFMGNVAHELKTPIFNIQGYVNTLVNGGVNDKEINVKYLKRTEKNVNRLISVVQDLDVISKLESGNAKLEIELFDIHVVIQDVFDMLQIKADNNLVDLVLNPLCESCFVEADKEKVVEVLMNLITNAIKYGNKGGIVKVSTRAAFNKVFIDVSDDGIGISKKDISHIFERFYRGDKSRSKEFGGSGLGLSIVKHIIDSHKQKIIVNSELGKGSTFTFSLKRKI